MKNTSMKFAVLLPILIAALVGLNGCGGTIAQKVNSQHRASFDPVPDDNGNSQNSGTLAVTNHQYIITATARARYNALIEKYGAQFTPALKADAGLTPCDSATLARFHQTELWLMDKYHMDKFATMTRLRLNPRASDKPP